MRLGQCGRGVALILLALSACADLRADADKIAARRQLTSAVVATASFDLLTYASPGWKAGAPLSVYIEGDGFAWVRRDRLSDDPTPLNPVALKMASRDPAPNILYIARPCQYVGGVNGRNCHPAYWSTARYSEEVVAALGEVVDRYRQRAGAPTLRLYGYSGGGTLALLLAARRQDVEAVTSVAAILDVREWTRRQGVTPLAHSLNPADFAGRLADVRQVHYAGAKDEVVPVAVSESYLQRFPPSRRPSLVVLPGQEHDCCWADIWPSLLQR